MTEWIVTSTVLAALVIAARYALRGKISLRLQYGLWLLVLLRLLIPVSFGGTTVSVANVAAPTQPLGRISQTVVTYVGGEVPDLAILEPDPSLPEVVREAQYEENEAAWQREIDAYRAATGTPVSVGDVLMGLWIGGGVVLAGILLLSNVRFARALRRSRRRLAVDGVKLPVYETAAVDTPCLFGLFRPAIYVTPEAAGEKGLLECTLAHEETHYRHGDHIWSALRCLCLVLHWYNPLVWWAAMLSRRDGELACDEATVSRLGEARRASYGRALIDLTCQKPQQLLVTATTMTGSAGSIKERIQLLVKKPKTTLGIFLLVALLAAVAVGCTFTGAAEENDITLPEDEVVDEATTEPEEPEETETPDGFDPAVELERILAELPGQPVRLALLVDIGVIADFDGTDCDNAVYFANNLAEYTYKPVEMDAASSAEIAIMPTAEDQDWSLTYGDDSDYVTLTVGKASWTFRAESDDGVPVGDIARWWYDEAEYGATGGYWNQDTIVIPDQGQDYLAAAQAFSQALEETHLNVSGGSKYCYSFVRSTVEPAEETTAAARERGEIGENTWAFWQTTVFVPENEDAMQWSFAGNTGEYTGSDPEVPEDAWEYYRCGYITLEDDGWHGEIVGTGW